MIVSMRKIYTAVKASDRDELIDHLREMGVVHLAPVDAEKAQPDEETSSAIQRLSRAAQILANVEPAGNAPDRTALDAADRVLEIYSRASDMRSRLSTLARQVDHLSDWGDVKLETFTELRDAGLTVKFYRVDTDDISAINADCLEILASLSGGRSMVVAVFTGDAEAVTLPETADEVPLPERDRPSLRAEAAEIDRTLKAEAEELCRLAGLQGAIETELATRRRDAEYIVAQRGGLDRDTIYAVQGWIPADKAETIAPKLSEAGIDAGIDVVEPDEQEMPPTLVKYPTWAKPIQGLFNILGTTPGYEEFDVSGAFMLALPLFAAMLIADGGYGLLFLLPAVLLYGKMCKAAGKPMTNLILIVGLVSVIWGVITCSFFGLGYNEFQGSETGRSILKILDPILLYKGSPAEDGPRLFITRFVFLLGAIHMSAAHLWQALRKMPSVNALSNVGWAIFLWGMLSVVNMLVIGQELSPAAPWLLSIGGVLAIIFAHPSKNIAKMLALGVADFPLAAIGTLSDVISYIRLMAVGLASAILASSFNQMGADVAASSNWIFGSVVLLLGHGLNLGLAIIALFAHGVRLNMLEFSNALGMEWSGYPYKPFAKN